MLKYSGAAHLRQRILLSLLSGKSVIIRDIRSSDENPGLKDFEIKLLKLMELITNGSIIEINYTGTEMIFKPGNIFGGELEFDCGTERSLVYYLEALLILAPFSKMAFRVTLNGITSDEFDQTIDGVKNVNLKILKLFGVEDGLDFKIIKRGSPPLGGGKIFFTCPVIAKLTPLIQTDLGKIKRIRGVAATTRVSPQISNRMIEAVRSQLNQFIPDIYIYSDVFKGEDAGLSSGYSLFLQAESTTNSILSADGIGSSNIPVEEMAIKISRQLLKQIRMNGIVDQSHQWMILLLMSLCPEDLSKIILGPISNNSKALLEDIKSFLGVSFKVRENAPSKNLFTVSCIGSGYSNLNRRTQ